MKCSICKSTIEETFLKKIIGTYIKDDKGKKHPVCFECQNKFGNDKKQMLSQM